MLLVKSVFLGNYHERKTTTTRGDTWLYLPSLKQGWRGWRADRQARRWEQGSWEPWGRRLPPGLGLPATHCPYLHHFLLCALLLSMLIFTSIYVKKKHEECRVTKTAVLSRWRRVTHLGDIPVPQRRRIQVGYPLPAHSDLRITLAKLNTKETNRTRNFSK